MSETLKPDRCITVHLQLWAESNDKECRAEIIILGIVLYYLYHLDRKYLTIILVTISRQIRSQDLGGFAMTRSLSRTPTMMSNKIKLHPFFIT